MIDNGLPRVPQAPRLARLCRHAVLAWWLLSCFIVAIDWQGRWIETDQGLITALKLWIFWASLAAPLMALGAILQLYQARNVRQALCWLLCSAVFLLGSWSRVVEPHLLTTRTTSVGGTLPAEAQPLRLALVADLHLGLFLREYQLRYLVHRLNQLDVDAVIVAGDWTYNPHKDLQQALAPLQSLRHPVYATLGNHDTQAPGPQLEPALRDSLRTMGITLLEGQNVPFKGWQLSGLDDAWGGDPRTQITAWLSEHAAHRIVVAHQPDTAALMPPHSAFLTLSGHTHGGQIALPWLTSRVLQRISPYGWYNGLYQTPASQLMVTPGVGTIGLPARLGTPPTIDILQIGDKP